MRLEWKALIYQGFFMQPGIITRAASRNKGAGQGFFVATTPFLNSERKFAKLVDFTM
jgi:hypothetical protein